jgi:hypothetical protein
MTNPIATAGQGFFTNGIEPTWRGQSDSTKFVGATADVVAGAPIAMLGAGLGAGDEQGKLHTAPANAADMFYGISASNINNLFGRVSLGEFEAKRADVWNTGRYTIRRSVYLNASNQEVAIDPFVSGGFPKVADIGKAVHAIDYTDTTAGPPMTNVADLALTGSALKAVLKWVLATGAAAQTGGTNGGFFKVAQVVSATGDLAAGDSSECELSIPGGVSNWLAVMVL